MLAKQRIYKAGHTLETFQMNKDLMLRYLICLLCFSLKTRSQNLLANGGFEDLNTCYEFQAQCSPAAWFTVMQNEGSNIAPKHGEHAMSFFFYNTKKVSGRSFPYTKILCPLKPNESYTISLWINCNGYPFSHLDVLVTETDPSHIKAKMGDLTPSFQLNRSDIKNEDLKGWIFLEKSFRPEKIENIY